MSAPIVITMGDPSGVGAEVTAKALADRGPDVRAETIVIGDRDTMDRVPFNHPAPPAGEATPVRRLRSHGTAVLLVRLALP